MRVLLLGNRRKSRLGASIMETLVVFAIIAILVALMLPAIQRARQSANRVYCASNLRQIGIACHTKGANGLVVFPELNASLHSRQMTQHAWQIRLLPYIEEKSLYNTYNFQLDWDHQENRRLLPLVPNLFLCPQSMGRTQGLSSYMLLFVKNGNDSWVLPSETGNERSHRVVGVELTDAAAKPWLYPFAQDQAAVASWFLGRDKESNHPGGFHLLFGDGHVEFRSTNVADPMARSGDGG